MSREYSEGEILKSDKSPSQIRNFEISNWTPVQSATSDFGFEMQESSDFKILPLASTPSSSWLLLLWTTLRRRWCDCRGTGQSPARRASTVECCRRAPLRTVWPACSVERRRVREAYTHPAPQPAFPWPS